MLRFHRQVFFDIKDIERLKVFTDELNSLNWSYTAHCLDNLKHRVIDIEGLLLFIKGLELTAESIFEFYADERSADIIKVCYRITWLKNMDIILVVNENKEIITIYMNSKEDNHITLRRELYING